jgi:hypothetical protein
MSGIAVLIVALILLIAAIYNLFPTFASVARRVYRAKKQNVSLIIICQKIDILIRNKCAIA